MNYGLSLLAGMLIAVMVVFNGGLNAAVGVGLSLVIIHIVGLGAIALVMALKKEKPVWKKFNPLWYVGGLIGILTTLFNLRAFSHISVSAMLALGLLGESLSGLLTDHLGFLGHPVRRFRVEKLLGGLVILAGIALMLTDFDLIPVIVSLLAGFTVLLSRLINGRLARQTSVATATLINYLTGLMGALLVLAVTGTGERLTFNIPLPYYLGGMLGATIVVISNHVVGRISSFYMTLALFIGQVSAGLLLDIALEGTFPMRTALGGLLVLLGLTVNLMQDKAYTRRVDRLAAAQITANTPTTRD